MQHFESLLQEREVGMHTTGYFKLFFLFFFFLNPSCLSEIKHKRTEVPGMPTTGHRQVEGRYLMKAWDTEEEIVHYFLRALLGPQCWAPQ